MFRVFNAATPLFNKLPSFPKSKSKRKRSVIDMALLRAMPVIVLQRSLNNSTESLPDCCNASNDVTTTTRASDDEMLATTTVGSLFTDQQVFEAALAVYNKQLLSHGSPGCSRVQQRWECRGEIRASFQLCVACKDIGKKKSYRETYYLDVLEVRQCRTILCRCCMENLLYKNVGSYFNNNNKIENKLCV